MPGVLFSSGVTWTEFRRTSLHILKDFGLGKESFENIVEEEVDNLINHIDQNFLNQPVDVSRLFNIAVLASLWRVISGECLKIGDPKLEYIPSFLLGNCVFIGYRVHIFIQFFSFFRHMMTTVISLFQEVGRPITSNDLKSILFYT